jgi:hypothetical protein
MAYELAGRAIYPLSQLLSDQELPFVSYIPDDVLEQVFQGINYTDAEAYVTADGLHFNLRLAFEGELALSPPGLSGFALLAGAAGDGWTSVPTAFVIGPEPSAELLEMPLTLRIERSLLKPMISRTEIGTGLGVDLSLGSIGFRLNPHGFDIDATTAVEIPLCMIGDSGVLLEASDVIFHLSSTINLPEPAKALGLTADWRGVYIRSATLWLPEALGRLAPERLALTDGVIGSGGFSGSVTLDWAQAFPADLFGIEVGLDHLGVTFTTNKLTQFDLRGSLSFPALKDANGNTAPIRFIVESGSTGYRISGGDLPQLKLGGLLLDLDHLAVGFDSTTLKNVDIAGSLRIPGLRQSDGSEAQVQFSIGYAADVFTVEAAAFPVLDLGPFAIAVNHLDASFDRNGLRSSGLAATLTIPGLEDAGGGPARVDVEVDVGADSFALTVAHLPPLKLGAIEIALDEFSLAFGKNLPLATSIAGKLTLPDTKDAAGRPIVIEFELEVDANLLRIATTSVPAFEIAGVKLQLTAFSIGFNAQGVVASATTIAGTMRVPAFKNAAGAPLDVAVAVDLTDGFLVTAQVPGSGLTVLDLPGTVKLALNKLSVGTTAAGVRLGIAGQIDNRLVLPVVDKLLPSTIKINDFSFQSPDKVSLDVALTWPNGLSAGSTGDGGFELDVPIGAVGAGLSVTSIHLAFRDAGDAHEFAVAFRGATLELGPVIGAVDGLGIGASIKPLATGGNLGPLQVDLHVIPPTGIGLSLDAGAVKLAGFLGIQPDGFVGAAELTIQDAFGLSLVGVLTTRLPDGSQGLSLLAIVSVELPVPIPLGYNFYFAGAGGLLGLNRGVDVDRLGEGLRTGAADHILFPKDVLRNINAIITDVREVFPPALNQFVIGPMILLTWNTPPLITAKVGLIVSFPTPVSVVILGALRAALPTAAEAILDLKVAFLGAIEFDKCLIRFDAAIYDSFIGRGDWKFRFEGDYALRISYGAKKDFVNSVGGFHPLYSPPAYLKLPTAMRRIRLTLLKDNPRLSLATYFAVTSNTVQFGAELDFRLDVAVFAIAGNFGFDVLFQFDPFHFDAHVWASLALKAGGADILVLKLDFQLQGTTPWIATGSASFKVLFWDVHADFALTFGESGDLQVPKIALLPILLTEFERAENWLGIPADGAELPVTFREVARREGEIIVDGSGALRISQGVIPLDMDLQRYGTAEPADASRVTISDLRVGGGAQAFDAATAEFAPAMYRSLSDREKLQAASFEPASSGVILHDDVPIDIGVPLGRSVRYERFVSDASALSQVRLRGSASPGQAERVGLALADDADRFTQWANHGVVAKSPPALAALRRSQGRDTVCVAQERFAVVRANDMKVGEGRGGLSRDQAQEFLRSLKASGYVVVPDFRRRAA